jgi:hypothetical protein
VVVGPPEPLDAEGRYFFGARATGSSGAAACERASMRRLPGLALELALRTRERVNIDPRTFTRRQREALGRGGSLQVDWTAEVL